MSIGIDLGFGSDVDLAPGHVEYDLGFGSPDTIPDHTWDQHDGGFGSPGAWQLELIPIVFQGLKVQDSGGDVVQVYFGEDWPTTGPYRARLVDEEGVEHPNDGTFLLPLRWGSGADLYVVGGKIEVGLLPAPRGRYHVRLRYGDGFVLTLDSESSILVQRRRKDAGRFLARSRWPSDDVVVGFHPELNEAIETLEMSW